MTNREQYERMVIIKDVEDKPLTIFQCPYYDKEKYCKCRAPFLINKKTGGTICTLQIEKDKTNNWEEAREQFEIYRHIGGEE